MPRLTIDGRTLDAAGGTVLEAATAAGIEISTAGAGVVAAA
jgi:hypothetical protein